MVYFCHKITFNLHLNDIKQLSLHHSWLCSYLQSSVAEAIKQSDGDNAAQDAVQR